MRYNRSLYWFSVLTAFTTFLLIGLGGLVTSHEAGMSVYDWPNSFGYNMFALPISMWTGGAFFEHTHRLLASAVGALTTILAVWIWLKDSRKWMHWLGIAAFLLVVIQGILGGLRVRWQLDNLGIPHGAIAQVFLVLTCAMALFLSRWWLHSAAAGHTAVPSGLRSHVLFVTVLIFIQLLLGATMRHQHAGLAISDFPMAHGKIWPDTSDAAIAKYNAERREINGIKPITAGHVVLQMIHRLMAVGIFLGVLAVAPLARKKLGADRLVTWAWCWSGLVFLQFMMGAATVWSNKAADIATGHVMLGALSLLAGALWWMAAERRTKVASA